MEIETLFFSKVDSTQLVAKRDYSRFVSHHLTCIVADAQEMGIGRFQRKWISPPGKNLYVTFVFRLSKELLHLNRIGQLLAVTLALLLEKKGLAPRLKWPNDLLLSQKKFSGILCHTQFEKEFVIFFLGIGININMSDCSSIDKPATSLKIESKHSWKRKMLLKELQTSFAHNLEVFKKEGFAPFEADFSRLLIFKGKAISYSTGDKTWEGILHGITPEGELVLQLPSNEYKIFPAGEIL
jgi:BirA family biotin operon repressor/biotin-[acetyl-CoA-carboxylase] ligase